MPPLGQVALLHRLPFQAEGGQFLALGEDFPEIAKADRQSIKHGILSVELDSERIAQDKMVAAIAGHVATDEAAPSRGLAHGALEAYLGMVIGEPDERDAEDLGTLLEPL